jgi:TonB family protein
MPIWSPVIAVALLVQASVFTLPLDVDLAVPVAASPCPASVEAREVPRTGVGRTVRPRLQKHTIAHSPTEFLAANVGDAKVLVSAVVDTDGQPCDLRIVRSSQSGLGLEEVSLNAVKQWRFIPAKTDGAPVRHTMTIEMHYSGAPTQTRSGNPAPGAGADAKQVDPLLQDSRPRITQMTPP